MPVQTDITNNSKRNVDAFVANASFGASGTKHVNTAGSTTTYNFQGIAVYSDAVLGAVTGFDSIHTGWNIGDTLYAPGYYPLSGTSFTLSTSGSPDVVLVAK